MTSWNKRKNFAIERLKNTELRSALDNVELATKLAGIINPVCKNMGLNLEITGARCFITRENIRKQDNNPYDIDINEDPNQGVQNVLVLTILLPHSVYLNRLNQIRPEIENALMLHGISSIVVQAKVIQERQKDLL